MKTSLLPDEHIQKEGLANCQRGIEAVGGRLYCTDQRLVFKSHKFNFQNGVTIIELSHVFESRPVWTKALDVLPLAPNSFEVQLKDGLTQSFVVTGRTNWITTIERLRTGQRPDPSPPIALP